MSREHYLFVTGRLAEPSLRKVVAELAPAVAIDFTVVVMPITVAALMTPKWIARRLEVPEGITRILVPGYCQGDLSPIAETVHLPIEARDRAISGSCPSISAGSWAPTTTAIGTSRFSPRSIMHRDFPSNGSFRSRHRFTDDGADVINLGCDPREKWTGAANAVRGLGEEGFRVSIDSYNPAEIAPAVRAGRGTRALRKQDEPPAGVRLGM